MTADRAALVERVAEIIFEWIPGRGASVEIANRVTDLIRAEVLEEAAREVEKWPAKHGLHSIAAAIRALKGPVDPPPAA